jgi:serine/threonine-protein kinase
MATTCEPATNDLSSVDLMGLIRRAGVLPRHQFEQVRVQLQADAHPRDGVALAKRLVKEGILTEYQVRLLLHGRSEGLVLGRYVLLDRLGKGAMGKVYKARHRLMGRIVALKFIAPEYLVRIHAVPRFLREIRLLSRLDHPNIVRALDADLIGKSPCIVMEYVSGQDLERRLLARGPLPPEQVVRFAGQAARGLAHAHDRGVIHRDIKPSNLLLGADGRLRILDLGLGSSLEVADGEQGRFATADGMVAGTVDYMSPEQAVGQSKLDGRSDLYSLGCVMYHLLTGQVPFPSDSRVECLAQRIRGRPEPITAMRPDLPLGLVGVVDRLMANSPDDRFQTAAEAAEALRALVARQSPLSHELRRPLPEVSATPVTTAIGGEHLGGDEGLAARTARVVPATWSRFLLASRERFPARVLLAGSAALLVTFAAGFALSFALR